MTAVRGPHSYYIPGQPRMKRLDWVVEAVDFSNHRLWCEATLTFEADGEVDLDTRCLTIESITDTVQDGPIAFTQHQPEAVLGQRLNLSVPTGKQITIKYNVGPDSPALQWLEPAQTVGKQHPFLFTLGVFLNTRAYIPCQDDPSVRFELGARITVPRKLRALVGAPVSERLENGELATETWRTRDGMTIPAYLIGLCIGHLESQDLTDRVRVWCEPEGLSAAAAEFGGAPKWLATAEKLYGPYPWGRFDILVMPPSFAYGGMEIPCLTYVSPALVTGHSTRPLVHVVIHELAHGFFGNLVTNGSWEEFALNEGPTCYAEWQIFAEHHGREAAELQAALLRMEYKRDVDGPLAGRPELTRLRTSLAGIDPDEVFSRVPFYKGQRLMRAYEEAVGSDRWNEFVKTLIDKFAFRSIHWNDFLDLVAKELPGINDVVKPWRWIDGEDLPHNDPPIESPLIDEVTQYAQVSTAPPKSSGAQWNDAQWMLYLRRLPRPVSGSLIHSLESDFDLTQKPNIEVRLEYLLAAEESGHDATRRPAIKEILLSIGRGTYIKPLYRALSKSNDGREWAREVFTEAKANSMYMASIERSVADILK